MILISTLPVKGEESLDLQSPLTTSPNLDNFISSSLLWWRPTPWVPGVRAGRHAKRRGTAAIQVCSCQPASMHRRTPGFESLASPCVLISDAHCSLTLCFTCSSVSNLVPLTLLHSCKSRLSLALCLLSLHLVMLTSTPTLAVVLSLTCCSTLT